MKTGLFYGTGTEKTTFVANKIRKAFGEDQIDIIPIESAWKRDFEAYDHIIAGTSTWFDGGLLELANLLRRNKIRRCR